MVWYRIVPGPQILLMPVILLLLVALGTGCALMTAALTVSYRDVQYVVPVLVMVLQYLSPVGYLVSTTVKGRIFPYYMLNPLASLIEAFRWSLLGHDTMHWGYLGYSAACCVVMLLAGALAFKRMERKFADII
jgi:lipopolysaccharide transport system permease protein